MQDRPSAPRLSPTPVSPGALLLRQFVTLLLLMISLAISFAFLFVQQVPTSTGHHSTLLVIWGGVRPDMINDRQTPTLNALAASSVVGLDNLASTTFAVAAPATTPTPQVTATITAPPAASPTAGTTATPAPTGTVTLTPAPTTPAAAPTPTAPSAGAQPTPTPGAAIAAPTTALTTLVDLTQAALAKGSTVSYEGTGADALQQSVPDLGNHAFILGDGTSYPTTLTGQLSAQGVMLPAAPDAAHTPDAARINALTDAYLKVILPQLKATSTPFLSIIREPEPETTATLNGIGAPSFAAALSAEDAALGQLMAGLQAAGLGNSVDVVVTSDHGLADVVPPDQTSAAGVTSAAPTPAVRTDLAQLLNAAAALGPTGPLPDVGKGGVAEATAVTRATTVAVTPGGGSDLLTLNPSPTLLRAGGGDAASGSKVVAKEVAAYLQSLPQVGPIFVNDALGAPPGTLALSSLGAVSATSPALVVGFVTFAGDVGQRATNTSLLAGSEYGDTTGLATWGAFGRRDLHTILYMTGPDFKQGSGGYGDIAPTSFADIAPTVESVMGLNIPTGQPGRMINEALASDTSNPADPTTTTVPAKAVVAGGAYAEVLVTEHFEGYDYTHGVYAVHGSGSANLDDLVTQATAGANAE